MPVTRGPDEHRGLDARVKTMLDVPKLLAAQRVQRVGGRRISKRLESQPLFDALSGNITPLTDALYNGLPIATQSILENENNPRSLLRYSVTPGR